MTGTASSPPDASGLLHNRTFDELAIGDTAAVEHKVTAESIRLLAALTGFDGPNPFDPEEGATEHLEGRIAHGIRGSALVAEVLGTRLPGPGATHLGQVLTFRAGLCAGGTITTRIEVAERDPASRKLRLACRSTNQDGTVVFDGHATLIAPPEKLTWKRTSLPELRLAVQDDGAARLIDLVRGLDAVPAAVVHPCDRLSLSAAIDARDAGLASCAIALMLAHRHRTSPP